MAFYSLRGPLEQNMGLTAAHYFLQHSYGRIFWDCSRAQDDLTALPWWKDMKPRLPPQAADAYEKHVRGVLADRNFFWLQKQIER